MSLKVIKKHRLIMVDDNHHDEDHKIAKKLHNNLMEAER